MIKWERWRFAELAHTFFLFQATRKYFLRFGPSLMMLFALMVYLRPKDIRLLLYKCCLVVFAVILAETIWILFYKFIFGRTEVMESYDKRSVLIFRGVLYAAIILGLTLGL